MTASGSARCGAWQLATSMLADAGFGDVQVREVALNYYSPLGDDGHGRSIGASAAWRARRFLVPVAAAVDGQLGDPAVADRAEHDLTAGHLLAGVLAISLGQLGDESDAVGTVRTTLTSSMPLGA